ncbi:peptide chain release factor N(5)-glutamine methyltransferase [Sphingobacteriaceae bacterium WQ 2009]|uniref:peptide chain release factor N(5)-glutamine methyltransferase n=1 Tax=Rhinopithecimicrobium faecis TaxID=2820698 RepID=A0A8T4HFU7_9SPHI|nr:peptide chain release factor N(5)-glutamine methyltransferase [Sphingobacteriaceae bacterium WQ 2009]
MRRIADFEVEFINELANLYDRQEAEELYSLLVENKLQIKRAAYKLRQDEFLTEEQEQVFKQALAALKTGKPIQYILNEAHFYGLTFEVNPYVLIPRAETEELVHYILQQHTSPQALKLIDIGTGSGCIPITLKKHLPAAQVSSLDISKEALLTAQKNATNNDVAIHFINADILEWEYLFSDQQFDIIVSNPPYITPKEKDDMHLNVLNFEPHLALFVEEVAPLLFYETIASFALAHLREQGDLYFEINRYYGAQTKDMLQKKGFQEVRLIQDMYGADRIIHARKVFRNI